MKKTSSQLNFIVTHFFNRQTGLIGLSLLCYILFKNSIIDLCNTLFVGPLLAKVSKDKTNDILMLVLNAWVVLIYTFWGIRKYKQSNRVNSIITLGGLIYIFHVYFDNTWSFTSYSEYSSINYLSIIQVLFICNSLLLLRNSYYEFRNLNTAKENKSSLLVDEPWNEEETDLLDIQPFAQKLAAEVKNIYVTKSFGIGIEGKWGSGKTSFINMLKAQFRDESEIIVIEFNPWKSSSPEFIINDFFNSVKVKLAKLSGEVSTELERYAQKLAEVDKSGFVTTYNKIFLKDESLEIQFTRINNIIKGFNKKLVIIIDDLDRLDKKEIIEVMRLIRNTGSFHNTIFIVPYDKDYVVNAVREINKHNSYFYLEKIFQLEYSLPLPMAATIKERLTEVLVNSLPNSEDIINEVVSNTHSSFYYKDSVVFDREYIYRDTVPIYIKTFRDVNRLHNSLVHDFKDLEGEISFRDYFLLELIKLKNRGLYDAIQSKKYLKTVYKEMNNSTSGIYVFQMGDFINEYSKNKSDFPIDELAETLQEIFPDRPKYEDRAVAVPSSFNIYFARRLFDNISLTKFRECRRNGIDAMKSFVDDVSEDTDKRSEFLEVIGTVDSYDDKKDFETIISTLFYLADKNIYYNNSHLISKIHSGAVETIIKQYYNSNEEEYKKFIQRNINSLGLLLSSALMSEIIRKYIYEKEEFKFILSLKECQEITVENLKKYLSGQNKISDYSFNYYYTCIETIEDVTAKVVIIKAANNIFKDFIETKDPLGYLRLQIRPYTTPNIYKQFVMEPFIAQTFDGYENFETFLSRQNQEDPIVKKVKTFYDTYKANSYQPIKWEE